MGALGRFLLLVSLLGLSACGGWQLRGSGGASFQGQTFYLDSQVRGLELRQTLNQGLQLSGAQLTDNRAQADTVLVVYGERVQRRALATEPNATTQEFEVAYTLGFGLERADGDTLLKPENVTVTQSYRGSRQDALSAQSQEARVVSRLRQDAVRRALTRVQASLKGEE